MCNYNIQHFNRACRELEKMYAMCGCWWGSDSETCHMLIIEIVRGKLQATFLFFEQSKFTEVSSSPIIQKSSKYFIQTPIGDIPLSYYKDSDTVKTDIRYKQASGTILKKLR